MTNSHLICTNCQMFKSHVLCTISRAGTFGAIFEYGAEKKVSQNSSLSAAVSLGYPTGVQLKLK